VVCIICGEHGESPSVHWTSLLLCRPRRRHHGLAVPVRPSKRPPPIFGIAVGALTRRRNGNAGMICPSSHGLFGKDWGRVGLWSSSVEWERRVVLGFFSHFFNETLHSACDGARAKSPNVFLGASTAQLQIPFTVLTTLLYRKAPRCQISLQNATRASKQPPQVFVVLVYTLTQASRRLLINSVYYAMPCNAHAAKYRNPSL
jgi:hypothetical protein